MTERPEGPDEGLREALARALHTATMKRPELHGDCEPDKFDYARADAVLPLLTAERERLRDLYDDLATIGRKGEPDDLDEYLADKRADAAFMAAYVRAALTALATQRDEARERADALQRQVDDERAAKRIAAEAADRFRDVLSECLGHDDENPGDDVLVVEVREHFGKTGPEPRRWRDFITGARATLDQIEAMPDPLSRTATEAETSPEETA